MKKLGFCLVLFSAVSLGIVGCGPKKADTPAEPATPTAPEAGGGEETPAPDAGSGSAEKPADKPADTPADAPKK